MATLTHQTLNAALVQQLAAAAAAVYDNPGTPATTTYIKGWRLFNSDTAARVVKAYLVQASGGALGTPSAANQVMQYTMGPGEWIEEEFPAMGIVLTSLHDAVFMSADVANKVNLVLFGDYAQ
jgi:hypothetical protein